MVDTLLVIFWGVILLSIVVVVHEAGHFSMARLFKVRVTEFMVGLPGPSIGFMHNGTRFGLTAIPLGGYARICGMDSAEEDPLLADALACVYRQGTTDTAHVAASLGIEEDKADELLSTLWEWGSVTTPKGKLEGDTFLSVGAQGGKNGVACDVADPKALLDEQRKGTYQALPCWKRLVILFAGPAFNIIFAMLIIILLLSAHGVYQASTTISGVTDGGPAATAGLIASDTITAIDGVPIDTWQDLSNEVGALSSGQTVEVAYQRDGQDMSTELTVGESDDGSAVLGIYAGQELVHIPVVDSFATSFDYIWQVIVAVAKLFWPTTAQETISQSVSVVGIAYEAKAAADMGILEVVVIGAAISMSLGIMNLIPLPPLDGGKIVIEICQRISRKTLSQKWNLRLSTIGMALLMGLFVILLFQDIGHYVLGG